MYKGFIYIFLNKNFFLPRTGRIYSYYNCNKRQQASRTGGLRLLKSFTCIKFSIMCLFCFLVSPIITISPEFEQEVEYRKNATFNCTASGNPSPTISWKFASNTLNSTSQKYNISMSGNSSTLVVRDLSRHDSGNYECHANNTVGNNSKTSELIVLSK